MTPAGAEAARAMDRMYRHQRHVYDATRRYYLLGRNTLLAGLGPPAGGSVLEVGCGTGRNLLLAARRYPDARMFGFDVSRVMLDKAAANIAGAGLAERVRLAQADATAFDPAAAFGVAGFDRVFVSYALSMIPGWREALGRAWGAVAPGGALHVVDFGGQEGLPRWFRTMLFAWLERFSVHPREELPAVLERIAGEAGARSRCNGLYGGYACYGVVAAAQ